MLERLRLSALVKDIEKGGDIDVVIAAEAEQAVERLERDNRTYIDEQHENMKTIETLQAQLAAAKQKDACGICWAVAWVPVDPQVPKEVDVNYLTKDGELYRCDCCWLKQQVAQLRGANASLIVEWTVLQELLERAGFPEGDGGLMGQVDAIYTAHTTLRGLVRTACKRWRAQTNAQEGISFRMAMKELEATLPREGGAQEGENGN